jgi:hypothetical protein
LSPPLTATGRGTDRAGESRGQDCVIPILEPGARTGKSTDDIRAGSGIGDPGDPMYTLQSGKQHGVCVANNTGQGFWTEDDKAGPLRKGNIEGNGEARVSTLVASTGEISHCLNAGGMGRIDYETETLVTHALRAGGFDASEDGTGHSTPLVSVVFDTTQVTSKANRSNPQPGDPCHPLTSEGHAPAIAFSCKDSGLDAATEIAPTLRSMGHDGSHANAGGQIAVAESLRSHPRPGSNSFGAVTVSLRGREGEPVYERAAVRRLTPAECETLMGFPRGWTAVP